MIQKLNKEELLAKWTTYREFVPVKSTIIPRPARQMRDELITEYLPLAENVAARMRRTLPNHIDKDDLVQWAREGLLEAIQNYDPDRGVQFEAFAIRRVHGKIIDSLRILDWAPRGLRKQQRDISKAEEKLQRNLNRAPTAAEVAEELDFTEHDISVIKQKASAANHTYIEESSDIALEIAPNDTEQITALQSLKDSFVESVQELSFLEQAIIVLCYYDNKKLSQIKTMPYFEDVKVGTVHSEAVLKIWQTLQKKLA